MYSIVISLKYTTKIRVDKTHKNFFFKLFELVSSHNHRTINQQLKWLMQAYRHDLKVNRYYICDMTQHVSVTKTRYFFTRDTMIRIVSDCGGIIFSDFVKMLVGSEKRKNLTSSYFSTTEDICTKQNRRYWQNKYSKCTTLNYWIFFFNTNIDLNL